MRAVVVAGRKPLYEMGAADLVVRGLDELSFINLKQLFSDEEGVAGSVSFLPIQFRDQLACLMYVCKPRCSLRPLGVAMPAGAQPL